MTVRVEVNPRVLAWAMDRAGMDIPALRHKFPKLPEWVIKMPDACIAHGVPWLNPFEMLTVENATF